MLVLTRRKGQSVRVGRATVTVVKGLGEVALGFDAPDDVAIVRGELEARPKPWSRVPPAEWRRDCGQDSPRYFWWRRDGDPAEVVSVHGGHGRRFGDRCKTPVDHLAAEWGGQFGSRVVMDGMS